MSCYDLSYSLTTSIVPIFLTPVNWIAYVIYVFLYPCICMRELFAFFW